MMHFVPPDAAQIFLRVRGAHDRDALFDAPVPCATRTASPRKRDDGIAVSRTLSLNLFPRLVRQ